MNEPAFLPLDIILFLHDQSVKEFGGAHGLRDARLLESVLSRACNKTRYEPDADLITIGSAYAFGLTKNHAFLDGNKRTAWACCGARGG